MKRVGVVVVAALALAVALAAFAPAPLLNAYLQDLTNGALRLAATSGTVWRGQGQLADAAGTWSIPMGWELAPLPLLRGEFDVTLKPPPGEETPRGRVRLRGDMVDLDQTVLAFPANALRPLFARVPGLALRGEINVRADRFTWLGKSGEGKLDANWRNAALVAMGMSAALGDVTLNAASGTSGTSGTAGAAGTTSDLLARVQNTGGDLRVAGNLRFVRGAADGDLTLQPTVSASPELLRALRLLGPPDANGAVRVRFPNG